MALKPLFQKISQHKPQVESVVLGALILTGMAAVLYYAKDRAADGMTVWFMAVIGMAAVFYCYKGSELACHAWFQRRAVKFLSSAFLLLGAFAIESWNHLSVGSKNQDELTANRVSAHTARDLAEANHNSALQARRSAQKALDDLNSGATFNETSVLTINGKTITTPEAAQAAIDDKKSHKWWNLTNACTETKGPETRKWCQEYRDAIAAKAAAGERIRKGADFDSKITEAKTRLDNADAEVKAAKATLDKTPIVTSKERADTRNIKKVANVFGVAEVDDNLLGSLLFVLGLTLFISIRKWQITAELYEDQPRKPWGFFSWLGSFWEKPVGGGVEQQITEAVHTIRNTPKHQPSSIGLKLSTISDLKRLAAA